MLAQRLKANVLQPTASIIANWKSFHRVKFDAWHLHAASFMDWKLKVVIGHDEREMSMLLR